MTRPCRSNTTHACASSSSSSLCFSHLRFMHTWSRSTLQGSKVKSSPRTFSLRDPKQYGFSNTRSHVTYMTTFFMETLAERHCGRLSLVHVFPGLVITNAFNSASLPAWFKLIWPLAAPIVRPFSVPPRECGERMLFLATPRFPARQTVGNGTTAKGDETIANEVHAGIAIGSDGKRCSGSYAVNSDGETTPRRKRTRRSGKKTWPERSGIIH